MREYVQKQTAILLRRLAFKSTARPAAEMPTQYMICGGDPALERCLQTFAQFIRATRGKDAAALADLMDACGRARSDIAIDLLGKAGCPRRRRWSSASKGACQSGARTANRIASLEGHRGFQKMEGATGAIGGEGRNQMGRAPERRGQCAPYPASACGGLLPRSSRVPG